MGATATERRLRALLAHLPPLPHRSHLRASREPSQLQAQLVGRNRGPTFLPSGEEFKRFEAPWTTRPELQGTFGMVGSSHYLASAAGMSILARAAVARAALSFEISSSLSLFCIKQSKSPWRSKTAV